MRVVPEAEDVARDGRGAVVLEARVEFVVEDLEEEVFEVGCVGCLGVW